MATDGALLVEAAGQGDVWAVRLHLDAGVDVDARNGDGRTALLAAVQANHLDLVDELLGRGADVNAGDENGVTPVFAAAHGVRARPALVAVVELLLERGADVNVMTRGRNGNAPLHAAAVCCPPDVVELMLEKGADANVKDTLFGRTPLLLAMLSDRPDSVALLLEFCADVDAEDVDGYTALHWAVREDLPESVEQLLEEGADVNAKSKSGHTPLHWAVHTSNPEFVQLLLAEGADVNAECEDGMTPLQYAFCVEGDLSIDVVELLLEEDADVNVKDDDRGMTPLHHAVRRRSVELVKALLEKGADVNAVDECGSPPLQWAASVRSLAILELLLEEGADVNARDNNGGWTALHPAAKQGSTELVEALLREGANINAKSDRGQTALHLAVRGGENATAHLLLEHGAVAVTANSERQTPLDHALKPGRGEPDVDLICRMLLPSGALVRLATDARDAHEKRLKRIVKSLKRAVQSPGFREDLADTLAGVDASGCARGTGAMLTSVLRQLDAFAEEGAREERERQHHSAVVPAVRGLHFFSDLTDWLVGCARGARAMLTSVLRQPDASAKGAGDGAGEQGGAGAGEQAVACAPKRRRLGDAYMARRGRHRLAVVPAVQIPDFLSELAEGLAGVNLFESDPGATKQLVAAAVRLDALAAAGAQQPGGAPKRRRRGVA